MPRIDKDHYYLSIAESVLERSTCLRRRYGAVIVKNDEIVSTGYNGSPRGEINCSDCGYCQREALKVPKGERYELCKAVHAEQNAIISAARADMCDGTIYIVGKEADGSYANPAPCLICRRMIVNAGITRCVGMTNNGLQEIDLKVESLPAAPVESQEKDINFELILLHINCLLTKLFQEKTLSNEEIDILKFLYYLLDLKKKNTIQFSDLKEFLPELFNQTNNGALKSTDLSLLISKGSTIWSLCNAYGISYSGGLNEKNQLSYTFF